MPLGAGRVIAVDWSGAAAGAERKIWLCEVADGGVLRLEGGRTREQTVDDVARACAAHPATVAGFDFAFSYPAWFLRRERCASARDFWDRVAECGARWVADAAAPFTRAQVGRVAAEAAAAAGRPLFRRTEVEVAGPGRTPRSVFQIDGQGQVGKGSIRGMPLLRGLAERGVAVWPFDAPEPGGSAAVEIYPRVLYAEPVVKARPDARRAYLDRRAPGLAPDVRDAAERSDDAFDALTAALTMWAHRTELSALPPARDDAERLEGRIWAPAARA
jgi:hypothetical protein